VSISFFVSELGAELIAMAIVLHGFLVLIGCWIIIPYLPQVAQVIASSFRAKPLREPHLRAP
jgi:hypothetical protein